MCVFAGSFLGPDGGAGGRSLQNGVGVRLPSSQMCRGGLGSGRAAQSPLPPLCHSAVRPHYCGGYCGFTADAAAKPGAGVNKCMVTEPVLIQL